MASKSKEVVRSGSAYQPAKSYPSFTGVSGLETVVPLVMTCELIVLPLSVSKETVTGLSGPNRSLMPPSSCKVISIMLTSQSEGILIFAVESLL